jgi:hypothetical protein
MQYLENVRDIKSRFVYVLYVPVKSNECGDDSPPNMPVDGTPKKVLSIDMSYTT